MKKLLTCCTAFLLAFCLLFMNAASAFAAPANTATPSATDVATQARTTAAYVLGQTNFSSLSDTSSFNNASKRLILAMRCNADYQSALGSYLSTVQTLLNSDGSLNISVSDYGYPNDTIADYANLLIVLALSGNNASDFHGINIISKFKTILDNKTADDFTFSSDPVTYQNIGMNPYYLGIVYEAVNAYSGKISTSTEILTKLKHALLSISNEKGYDYYGYSIDNSGSLYPQLFALYQTDVTVQTLFNKILAYSESTYSNQADGSSTNYGTPNSDSTALALALYSQYGELQNAAMSYHALLTYQSAVTTGCYVYGSTDSLYSSQDALNGLVTYLRILDHQTNPYDVSDILNQPLTPTDNGSNNGTNTTTNNIDSTTTDNTISNSTTAAESTTASIQNNTTDTASVSSNTTQELSSADTATSGTSSVATGDETNVFLFIGLLLISAASILIFSNRHALKSFPNK